VNREAPGLAGDFAGKGSSELREQLPGIVLVVIWITFLERAKQPQDVGY
jgi:hypothetical protein